MSNLRRILMVCALGFLAAGASVAVPASAGAAPPPGQPSPAPSEPTNPWLQRRVLDIAHAGGEDEAPAETLFGYRQAWRAGAEVLEGDVHLTADGTLVALHDATVDRTTNGTGRIADLTFAQAHALDAAYDWTPDRSTCVSCPDADKVYRGVRTGDRRPPRGSRPSDFAIPAIDTLLRTFPQAYFDLEIKESGEPAFAAARELARLIRRHHAERRVIVVSFDDANVAYFKSLLPDVATSPGTTGVTQFFFDRQPQPDHTVLQVPPEYELNGVTIPVVSQQFVDDAHNAGLAVWVWMNGRDEENAEFYDHLLDMGVDGILGSAPRVARSVIDARDLTWTRHGPPRRCDGHGQGHGQT